MKYYNFKQENSKKFEAFPMAFAYNKQQFEEAKIKLGVKDSSELYSIWGNGLIRKTDSEAFNKLVDDIYKSHTEFLAIPENLKDAMVYELENHEFCYTGEVEDTLEALGLSLDTITEEQKNILKEAIKTVRENDKN